MWLHLPELNPLSISACGDAKDVALHVCVFARVCVCVCLQSTRGEGESAEGAALTPYRPPANPPGRVK